MSTMSQYVRNVIELPAPLPTPSHPFPKRHPVTQLTPSATSHPYRWEGVGAAHPDPDSGKGSR